MIKVIAVQLNYKPCDINHNIEKIKNNYIRHSQCDLVIFSELSITGYNISDYITSESFIYHSMAMIEELKLITLNQRARLIVGGISKKENDIYNTIYIINNGIIEKTLFKTPYLSAEYSLISHAFKQDNTLTIEDQKFVILLDEKERNNNKSIVIDTFSQLCYKKKNYIKNTIYINHVGGEGELIFAGCSRYNDIIADRYLEDFIEIILPKNNKDLSDDNSIAENNNLEDLYSAITISLRNFYEHNNFQKITIGLSGGMDSAMVLAIAADAIGIENINIYILPSKYSSNDTLNDAIETCNIFNIKYKIINIENIIKIIKDELNDDSEDNIAAQNLQSRIRAVLLMYDSNLSNTLLVNTGNKSENAMGYSTLYGDSCGGYAPIKNIYKTEIYKLAEWRNDNYPKFSRHKKTNIFLQNILTKAPSAELKPDQKDSDDLPEYNDLDPMIEKIISNNNDMVDQNIEYKFNRAKFKRKQGCIGGILTNKCFNGHLILFKNIKAII